MIVSFSEVFVETICLLVRSELSRRFRFSISNFILNFLTLFFENCFNLLFIE